MSRVLRPKVFMPRVRKKAALGPPVEAKDRFNVRCDPSWYLKMARHAAARGLSLTEFVRKSCEMQLAKDAK